MRETSELYKRIIAAPGHAKEQAAVINGEVYEEARIVSAESYGGIFERDSLCIGSAVSRQADVTVFMPGDVPAGAEVKLEYRLTLDGETSEWVPKGVFFVDTRETDSETGVLTLHCFDAMLKAETPWEPEQSLVFPMTMPEAMRVTAALIGLEIDPRSELIDTYTIDYPATGTTVRQIWRWIAAAHGGNWTVTEDGKLRLLRLRAVKDAAVLGTEDGEAIDFGGVLLAVSDAVDDDADGVDQTEVGKKAAEKSFPGTLPPVSKVILDVDTEHYYVAGDDSGQTVEAECPYATQAMTDALLEQLRGYEYQPAVIADALINPAVELGDRVTVNEVSFTLAEMETVHDALMASDISAPGQRESEHELGTFIGPLTREFNRKLAENYAALEKNNGEVRAYVENQVQGALAEVDVKLDTIKLEVSQEAGADGRVYARLTLTVGPNKYSGLITMEGNLQVSGQLSADALYAALGDIADLTVDRVSTSRRIVLYLKKDMSDDNYVRIRDQYIELVTGSTDGTTEQAVNPSGVPIYWEDDPEGATLGTDGYPYRDGQRIYTTTKQTPWPVTVYRYGEAVKYSTGFEKIDGVYTPVVLLGAGDQDGNQRARLVKKETGLELLYTTIRGKEVGMTAGDDGYLDLYGLRKTVGLDFSGWDSGTFTETVEGVEEPYSYRVDFDDEGRPVKISDDTGFELAVTW